jgi:hypothetical protein
VIMRHISLSPKRLPDSATGKGDFLLLTAGGGITRLQVPLIGEQQLRQLPYAEKVSMFEPESTFV